MMLFDIHFKTFNKENPINDVKWVKPYYGDIIIVSYMLLLGVQQPTVQYVPWILSTVPMVWYIKVFFFIVLFYSVRSSEEKQILQCFLFYWILFKLKSVCTNS